MFTMRMFNTKIKNIFKRMKEKWDAYLVRMAESNKQLYGNKRLDCCGMNQSAKTHNQKN